MSKKVVPEQFIHRPDAFFESLTDYEMDKSLANLKSALNFPRYNAGKTDISSRVLSHWNQNGLLPEGVKNDLGWHKFTLIEMVWLRVASKMRAFGISLEKIAQARARIMKWDREEKRYPVFEFYVVKGMASKLDPYVVLLANGVADAAFSDEIEVSKLINGNRDMLLISLKGILKETGLDPSKADMSLSLSDEMAEVLAEIRNKNNKEVSVKVDQRGEVTEMEAKSVQQKLVPNCQIQSRIEGDQAYARMITEFEKGERKSVQVIKKKRFKK